MSYCRWSSDYFKSDVYVYEDVSGLWVCHVAVARYTSWEGHPGKTPKLRPHGRARKLKALSFVRYKKWAEREQAWIEKAPRENIPHELAGKTVTRDCPGDMAEALGIMKRQGLHVPDGVIDILREEQAELDKEEANGQAV